MTILKAINILLFQWFFIRLTKHSENRIEVYELRSIDLMHPGYIASCGAGQIKTYEWYSFQYWIVPCSGWNTNFIYLNKKSKFFNIKYKIQ